MDAKRTAHLKSTSSQHHSGDDHVHLHSHGATVDMGGRLITSLVLTLLFVIGEFLAGLSAHSLALMSDAGHNLTDALAVGFSLWAVYLARRGPTPEKTFGFHRAGVLTAALNASTLVVIALLILFEAVRRFLNPEPVDGITVIIVASIAVVLNTVIALVLRAGSSDINIRSTLIHMMGDAIAAVGVILAGIGILLTGWHVLDPLVSVLIGVFILWSSWGIIKEAANILMEGTPANINMGDLIADMGTIPGVQSVHDVHVWTIGTDKLALSAHVNTGNCSVLTASQMFVQLNKLLETHYHIVHSTLQAECLECDPNDQYCSFHLQETAADLQVGPG